MIKWIVRICILLPLLAIVYYFLPEEKLPNGVGVDRLVVIKSKRIMEAYSNGKLMKVYKIALGGNPIGDKQVKGDEKTPEGTYRINAKNPNSGYHKNLGISYPNKQDKKEANQLGVDPGGDIKIHSLRNGRGFIGKFHRLTDWTAGCIAVTDQEMDELYEAVAVGTSIEIRP